MARRTNSAVLEMPLPASRHRSLGLVLFRRLAGCGLNDARATMLALDAAGAEFRKLLVLVRSLVVELARTSRRSIAIAPCCAAGMTRDEGLLMALLDGEGLEVHSALTDDAPSTHALSLATALGKELERVAQRNGWRV